MSHQRPVLSRPDAATGSTSGRTREEAKSDPGSPLLYAGCRDRPRSRRRTQFFGGEPEIAAPDEQGGMTESSWRKRSHDPARVLRRQAERRSPRKGRALAPPNRGAEPDSRSGDLDARGD